MKNLATGILAHVDSGKTTLSEALLYTSGEIRRLGRVDHRDAFLDTNEIERERGITIFSKQANLTFKDMSLTLVDTPGHVDFSAETERTLRVLDYAILVISAPDGIQSHTEALFRLLSHYAVPTFIFVNKMDMEHAGKEKILLEIKEHFGDSCIDFSENSTEDKETIALCDESLMEEYLSSNQLSERLISEAIKKRKIFPCFFGSALKLEGIEEFLNGFDKLTFEPEYPDLFGARIYKISEDERGTRLTHIKITGGTLKVRDLIGDEKISEIRIYSGTKYKNVQEVKSGEICTLTGLSKTLPGQGVGYEKDTDSPFFEPVLSYSLKFNEQVDINIALRNLRKLEEEDSNLHIVWQPTIGEIHIQLMGKVQSEILKRIIKERFSMDVDFEESGVIYKETILDTVEGAGHYEPLRHYAEVHLLLEPGKAGSGLVLKCDCSEDELDRNWQRLILTHLEEKTHLGVLTGSPITDMKITLIAGRAHNKHTEGGDFRQATYRAVRQGLRFAKSILLEPWYEFVITLPSENVGRAMTDIQNMNGSFSPPEPSGNFTVLKGKAPVAKLRHYFSDLTAYTHGAGRLALSFSGYEPCHNQDEVIEKIAYNCDADTENTADSVFCSHGAGYLVRWDEADELMHIPKRSEKSAEEFSAPSREYRKITASDDELIEIFERTYGKIQRKNYNALKTQKIPKETLKQYRTKHTPAKKVDGEYLLVDGYNILFAWYDLKNATKEDLDFARTLLINRLSNYREMQNAEIIVVFDAYKVKGGLGSIEKCGNISVVYTKEAESADSYIEKTSKELMKNYAVKVATSDRLEQIIIFGGGAVRISAEEFLKEIEAAEEKIKDILNFEKQKSAVLTSQIHEIKYQNKP